MDIALLESFESFYLTIPNCPEASDHTYDNQPSGYWEQYLKSRYCERQSNFEFWSKYSRLLYWLGFNKMGVAASIRDTESRFNIKIKNNDSD